MGVDRVGPDRVGPGRVGFFVNAMRGVVDEVCVVSRLSCGRRPSGDRRTTAA